MLRAWGSHRLLPLTAIGFFVGTVVALTAIGSVLGLVSDRLGSSLGY